MKKSITFTRIYSHPIEKVWAALIDPEAMSIWLMPTNFKPVLGQEFQFKTRPYPGFDGITRCKVIALEKNKLLSFSWSGGSLEHSIVTFRLSSEGANTRMDFEHKGFEGFLNNLIVKRILSYGWKHKILPIKLTNVLSDDRRI